MCNFTAAILTTHLHATLRLLMTTMMKTYNTYSLLHSSDISLVFYLLTTCFPVIEEQKHVNGNSQCIIALI